jgi:hypothetical protein
MTTADQQSPDDEMMRRVEQRIQDNGMMGVVAAVAEWAARIASARTLIDDYDADPDYGDDRLIDELREALS